MKVSVAAHVRFGKCRVGEGGWYVAADVCRILGYTKATAFANKHTAQEDTRYEVVRAIESPHCAKMLLVNERGLKSIIDASGNIDGDAIKAWLLSASVEENALVAQNLPKIINDPDFGKMRWIMLDGVVWFVAADMCRILDLQNTTQALATLDDDEKCKITEDGEVVHSRLNTSPPYSAQGGEVEGSILNPIHSPALNLVNEYGLYRLILQSRKPEAKPFQRKIYHEILPAINKYGYYSVKPTVNAERIEKRVKKQLSSLSKCEFAVVYLLFMSNLTVKIGYTSDLTQRVKQIMAETGLEVLNFKSTPFMPLDEARAMEAALKEKYKADCIEGEYYDTRFTDICKEL